jgi:hypothetical protein
MRRPGQISIRLRPQCDGAFTRWQLSGSTVTTAPPEQVRDLMRMLSHWSGSPVELVLPAEDGSAEWFDWWADTIAPLPARRLEVRFALHPRVALRTTHDH